MTVQSKFETTRNELNASLIERDEEVTISMTALLAGEHCLFVGPPGTAKSLLADSIVSWIDGNNYSLLLNKFTKPEEVFGPVDVMAMKAGEYRRITTGMLPECEVAFLDEIFKASSAILNTTLKILNERLFQNGSTVMHCPLKLAIAASNEWPTEAKELGALFDRFLFRKTVAQVSSQDNVDRLMFGTDLTPTISSRLTIPELKAAQVECKNLPWDDSAKELIGAIRRRVTAEGVIVGDRRLRKSVEAVQCFAWLNGNPAVTTDDLEILSHIWWSSPEQFNVVADAIGEIAQPSGLLAAQLLSEANGIMADVDVRDLSACAVASKKLGDIAKRLVKMTGPRAEQAQKRVLDAIRNLKLQTIEAL